MKKLLLALLLFIIVGGGSAAGSYFVTKHYTYKTAYAKGKSIAWQSGYNKGHAAGLAEVGPRIEDDEQKLADMRNQYNTLLNQVKAYVPQQSSAIHCASSSYGINNQFTNTNCY